jgi:hypothetical protein
MLRSASGTVAPLLVFLVACSHAGAPGAGTASHGASTSSTGSSAGAGGAGGGGGAHGSGGAGGTGGTEGTGGSNDAGPGDASPEAGAACSVDGVEGQCLEVSACAALTGYSSTPGFCPGPADVECCTMGPSVADNPPTPAGWELMEQSEVTPAMTTWAVDILDDPTDYPMFSTAMMTFGTLMVLARVEWHPPDFQNDIVHRGVTLYQPVGS